LEYHLALEKAVLEFAHSGARNPGNRSAAYIRIPGYNDSHVSGLASQLFEQGLISASSPDERGHVRVTGINEAGTIRLRELESLEQKLLDESRIQMEQSIELARERARQNKWWRRMLKGGKTAA
jgi:hypothetical protein